MGGAGGGAGGGECDGCGAGAGLGRAAVPDVLVAALGALCAVGRGGVGLGAARLAALVGVPMALAGLGVALWQVAAQQGWLPWPPSCTAAELVPLAAAGDLLGAMQTTRIIPCDQEDFTLLGLSLAAWNVPTMLVVLGLLGVGGRK